MSHTTRLKSDVKPDHRRDILSEATCRYCGDRIGPFEVDHIRPLSRGGTNEYDNLGCACVSCNTQKSNFLLHEWIQWRKTNGMSWPPMASHATDPQHFQDFCQVCRDRLYDSTPPEATIDPKLYIFPAIRLTPDSGGYLCHYRCPEGHAWTCWYGTQTFYYIDCPCPFCQSCREEEL